MLKPQANWSTLVAAAVLMYVPVAAAGLKAQTAPELGQPVAAHITAPSPTASPTATPARTVSPAPATAAPKPKAVPKVLSVAAKAPAAPATLPGAAGGEIASEATCPGQSQPSAAKAALACLTAQARAYHGLAPTTVQAAVMAAADSKVRDMVECGYSHTACDRAANYWLGAQGYTGRCSGENIALGQTSPRAVFISWMNSPGHRANILGAKYTHVGAAVAADGSGRWLWVMELGGC